MEVVDFHNSSIIWDTLKENSIGIFGIESVLQLNDVHSQTNETYALSTAVLAGNMYEKQNLAVDPPYLFQIAGGKKDHIIYRTYLQNDENEYDVSEKKTERATQGYNKNKKVFSSIKLDIKKVSAKSINSYESLYKTCQLGKRLSGMIELKNVSDRFVCIEFPVKHINLLPKNKMWQLETGPILFTMHLLNNNYNSIVESLFPCFIHANRFDTAYITADFPFNIRKLSKMAVNVNYKCKCGLTFFSY